MATVTIGMGQDYNGITAAEIKQALADGHRHLIFTDNSYRINDPINLDSYPNTGALILEGAAPDMTNLNMDMDFQAPCFSGGVAWTLIFSGIHVRGAMLNNLSWLGPCCRFTNFASVEFTNCEFGESKGKGVVLERTDTSYASTVKLVNSRFDANDDTGLLLSHVGLIDLVGGTVQTNKGALGTPGLHVLGGAGGTLRGIHFEDNGQHELWGTILEAVSGVKLLDCYCYASKVWLKPDTSNCLIENNAFFEVSNPYGDPLVKDEGVGNTVALNNKINQENP